MPVAQRGSLADKWLSNGDDQPAVKFSHHETAKASTSKLIFDLFSSQYIYQTASAIEHCHGLNLIHRDLKLENILLGWLLSSSSQFHHVHIPTGMCKCAISAVVLSGRIGRRMWEGEYVEWSIVEREELVWVRYNIMPLKLWREMNMGKRYYSIHMIRHHSIVQVDIWAIGIILFEMLTAKNPFGDYDEDRIVENRILRVPNSFSHLECLAHLEWFIIQLEYNIPADVDPAPSRIIKRLLKKKPEERMKLCNVRIPALHLSFNNSLQLMKNPWIRANKWEEKG